MSWTTPIAPTEAGPRVTPVYESIRARSSRHEVSQIWQTLASDPEVLAGAFDHYNRLLSDPAPLSLAQAQLIALVVSATNGCGYCVSHVGPRLAAMMSDELARSVARDYREANLTARDRVLLDAAVALTCEPSERKAEDVERLREYGFDDAGIVRATAIAAYYNFINRCVSALGVDLELGLEAWEFGAQR
ncbi:MAG: peroxidase-related enzyme [Candidatus Eisenbacteria bacterium]